MNKPLTGKKINLIPLFLLVGAILQLSLALSGCAHKPQAQPTIEVPNDATLQSQTTEVQPPIELPKDADLQPLPTEARPTISFTQDATLEAQSAELEAATMRLNEQSALAAANDAIRLKLADQQKASSDTSNVEAVAFIRQSAEKNILVFRHTADWVEWSESRKLSGPEIDLVGNATQLVESVNLEHVGINVMSQADVDRKLKECHPALVLTAPKLNPPFFNNATNVKWNERDGAPILRSIATLDWDANKCIRADINLRDGSLLCREVGCVAH